MQRCSAGSLPLIPCGFMLFSPGPDSKNLPGSVLRSEVSSFVEREELGSPVGARPDDGDRAVGLVESNPSPGRFDRADVDALGGVVAVSAQMRFAVGGIHRSISGVAAPSDRSAATSSQIVKSQNLWYSARNAKTPSTIRTAVVGSVDGRLAVVVAGERIVPAEHHYSGALGTARFEE